MSDSEEDPRKHRRPLERINHWPPWPPTQKAFNKYVKDHRSSGSSFAGSCVATVVSYPLDTIKTRMQGFKFGVVECTKTIFQNEGIAGFYRGIFAPILTIACVRMFTFSVYQDMKYVMDDYFYDKIRYSPLQQCNTIGSWPNFKNAATFGIAGAVSGGLSSLVSCPFELTKIAAQLAPQINMKTTDPINKLDEQHRKSYEGKGTAGIARQLLKNRGPLGLYCGWRYQFMRDTVGTSVYFSVYESVKQVMGVARGKAAADHWAVAIAGFCCGSLSWAACYPLDTAKTRYQKNCLSTHPTNTTTPKMQVFNRSVWNGLVVGLSRSGLTSVVLFLFFEESKKKVNNLQT